jgi:hypothetical protein
VVARFASVLASLNDEDSLPTRLCQAGTIVLGADGAAITLNYADESRLTVSTSEEMAALLEDLQEVIGQGPGFDAATSGEIVTCVIGTDDGRWPRLAENISSIDFDGALVAIPLGTDGHTLGVLTAHATGRDITLDLAAARFLSATMGAALLLDPELGEPGHEFEESWSARSTVHQATGMVVAQVGVRTEDALALLRGQAFTRGVSLAEVAADIVERRINFRHFTIEGD